VGSALSQALCSVFELALGVLRPLPEWAQLGVLAAPAALLALGVFRVAANQDALERARQRVQAHLLELLLFRDDLRVTLRAQLDIARHNFTYLRHAALPVLILAGPFALLLVQVEAHFALRSLVAGETARLGLELDDVGRAGPAPSLGRLPDGLSLDAPPVRIPALGQVVWRLRAVREGSYDVPVLIGPDLAVTKRVRVGTQGLALTPVRLRSGDLRALAYPGEPTLPADSPARALRLDYPLARSHVLGLSSASWIFTAWTLVWGFALRRPLGVRL